MRICECESRSERFKAHDPYTLYTETSNDVVSIQTGSGDERLHPLNNYSLKWAETRPYGRYRQTCAFTLAGNWNADIVVGRATAWQVVAGGDKSFSAMLSTWRQTDICSVGCFLETFHSRKQRNNDWRRKYWSISRSYYINTSSCNSCF